MNDLGHVTRALGACAAFVLFSAPVAASPYLQTNLVSDVPGLAQLTDPNLRNPWGVSFSPTGPFWMSNQGTNTSTLYRVNASGVSINPLVVAIPTTACGPQGPTGQVFNDTSAFLVNAAPASFIFANLNGTISAWNGSAGTIAQVRATTPGAVYTGLAISNGAGGPRLYATNGVTGRIDVFDGAFAPVPLGASAFVNADPRLAGLVPFNVENIGGSLYVSYALPGRAAQIAAGEGSGAVAVYDLSGNLIRTLVAGSVLASPWAMTLAPASFGGFGGSLLIGNFSFTSGEINAFDPLSGAYLGTIGGQDGLALANEGLWDITFGNGGTGGLANTLYLVAGIQGETHGLFASITAIPEPESLALLAIGVLALAARRRR